MLLFILILAITITACSRVSNDDFKAALSIKVGETDTTVAVKSRGIDTVKDEDTELFQAILKDEDVELPYIPLGEKIQFEFKDEAAQSYELTDYVLNEDGKLKYKQTINQKIDMAMIDGTGTFILQENLMTMLSSQSQDYEPGATLRGFRLICKGDNGTKEYAFVIRTDALKTG